MNQFIKPEIDFTALVNNQNNALQMSVNFKSKLIDKLKESFIEKEQQWYLTNLYIYMNYHSTNDYVIDLENVYKMIGFANKANAKRTLVNII